MSESQAYITTAPSLSGREPDLDLAFGWVGADAFARLLRLRGRPVRFVAPGPLQGGTQAAAEWQGALRSLDVACADPVPLADPRHARVAKVLFLKLLRQGDAYRAAPEGEDACFLAVGKRREAVLGHLRAQPDAVQPPGAREAALRLAGGGGAPDPCLARRREGAGTQVPGEPGFVLEPWFDLFAAYLVGCGYLDDAAAFEALWPPHTQVICEEALGLHAVAWPAMLAALGLPPPQRLLVRGSLRTEAAGGEARQPGLRRLAGRYGADALRCALLGSASYLAGGQVPPGRFPAPADPFAEAIQALLNAVLAVLQTERGGVVPSSGPSTAAAAELLRASEAMEAAVAGAVAALDFRRALSHIGSTAARAAELARRAGAGDAGVPARPPRQRDAELAALAQATCRVAGCLAPLCPSTAAAICRALGTELREDPRGERGLAASVPPGAHTRQPDGPLPLLLTQGG